MSTKPGQLDALTGLRFVAALAVVVHHCDDKMGIQIPELPLGNFAVTFFFVLSGFILSYAYHGRLNTKAEFQKFWVTRVARIWPLHLTCLLIALLCTCNTKFYLQSATGMGQLFSNIFLLQAWAPSYDWGFSLNGVSWSISNELFFYAMFPFLFWGGSQAFAKKYVGLALFTLLALISLHWCARSDYFADSLNYRSIVHLNPLLRLLEFATGMGVGMLPHLRQRLNPSVGFGWHDVWAELLAIGLVLGASYVLLNHWIGNAFAGLDFNSPVIIAWTRFSAFTVVFAAVVAIFASSKGPVAWLLSRRPMVFLGEISFSLYMIHQIVISVWVVNFAGVTQPPTWLSLVSILGISGLSSWCLYRLVELPAKDWILQVYQGKWRQATIALLQQTPKRILFVGLPVACALMLSISAVRNHQQAIEQSLVTPQLKDVLANSIIGKEAIEFGDDATLFAVSLEAHPDGLRLKTAWRSNQPTGRERFLHICNHQNVILRHAKQSNSSRWLPKQRKIWVDHVLIPFADLQGADKLGIGIFEPGNGASKINRGKRSMNNRRLDIELPVEAIRIAAGQDSDPEKQSF